MSRFCLFIYLLLFCGVLDKWLVVESLGVNWGTMATHKLPPKVVVQMLTDNGIKKVKLFDADQSTMSALAGTDIEVMVAIPNDQLSAMGSYDRAKEWVKRNITRYNFNGGVNIKYVAVGNEPFLTSYNNSFVNTTFPALQNIQNALNEAGVGDSIKATVPLNADVYGSPENNPVPSSGRFRTDISDQMSQIVKFLNQNKALHCKHLSLLESVGWPTDGDKTANINYALRFYRGLLPRLAGNKGTPLRPGYIEVYLFGLIDEDAKSIAPGNFERHWGIFRYDGQPKFPMDLSGQQSDKYLVGAQNVNYLPTKWCMLRPDANDLSKLADNINYACTFSDCTALGFGSSCNGLDANGNASYAFNMYFQVQNQRDLTCNFQGLAMVTDKNISQGNCNFTIQIATSSSSRSAQLSLAFLTAITLLLL
ncbi:UNVERIFIED_CONTAM: Glucan endo-1,3-beta-glucosidase 8 [Sesamum angustifolium]|uniref:Glucan endo-1,3-beta-glucosidase 8 n=1 Tax=Sesamum angustifolium TaxID=2727405 RepID=A0AAW2MU59_9LAMI